MNDSALTKAWTSVSLLALYCAVNGVADIQGSSFLLPFLLEVSEERGKSAKAIFWFLLSCVPYVLSLYLAGQYMRRKQNATSLERWPVMFGFGLLMSDRLARRYQQFWLATTLLIPLYACGFLLNEVFELEVVRRGYMEPAFHGWWKHLTEFRFARDFVAIDGEAWRRLTESGTATRDELDAIAVSYFPGFQPWVFIGILLVLLHRDFDRFTIERGVHR